MKSKLRAAPGNPLHTAGPRAQRKPRIYNRPWHLDADERRHGGKRKWDPQALEMMIELAGQVDWLYPPDFSGRDVVRLRGSGREKPAAELRTSGAGHLRLIVYPRKRPSLIALRKRLGLAVEKGAKGIELRILTREQVAAEAFTVFFLGYLQQLRED